MMGDSKRTTEGVTDPSDQNWWTGGVFSVFPLAVVWWLRWLGVLGSTAVVVSTAIVTAPALFFYSLTTWVLGRINRIDSPKTWSMLRAARLGSVLMPLVALVLAVTLPWTWPLVLAAAIGVPLVFALFQRGIGQRIWNAWAASPRASERRRSWALWLGADVQHQNDKGESVAVCALRSGHAGVVKQLISLGVEDFGVKDFGVKDYRDLYQMAADRPSLIDCFKEQFPDHYEELKEWACMKAMLEHDAAAIQCFVKHGVSPNMVCKVDYNGMLGHTLLTAAVLASVADLGVMRDLLQSTKVDIDQINNHGEAALHVAILSSNLDAVRLLLQKGADPTLPVGDAYKEESLRGKTPLELADHVAQAVQDGELQNIIKAYMPQEPGEVEQQPKPPTVASTGGDPLGDFEEGRRRDSDDDPDDPEVGSHLDLR